jgi:hypothetical protein
MSRLFLILSRWSFGGIVLGATALTVSAGNVRSVPSHAAKARPASQYTFLPVDYPTSPPASPNVVTGINQDGSIVGVFGNGCGGNNPYNSWMSTDKGPPWTHFQLDNYSSAAGTYLASLDSNEQENGAAGWVCSPNGRAGTWGAIRPTLSGSWYLVPPSGTGPNAVTQILGLNDWVTGVGFFKDGAGVAHPFAVNCPNLVCGTSASSYFSPGLSSSARAVSMNTKGDVVGVMTVGSTTEGWYYVDGGYYTFQIPQGSGTNTVPYGINWQDEIVGTYVDGYGVTHGFVLGDGTKGGKGFTTFDEPNARSSTTILTDINDHECISGSYQDTSGTQHGFVAMPTNLIFCNGTTPSP